MSWHMSMERPSASGKVIGIEGFGIEEGIVVDVREEDEECMCQRSNGPSAQGSRTPD